MGHSIEISTYLLKIVSLEQYLFTSCATDNNVSPTMKYVFRYWAGFFIVGWKASVAKSTDFTS